MQGVIRRHTVLVQGPLVRRTALLDAARERAHGRQVLGIEQLAARLAGGFLALVDREALQGALDAVVADPAVDFGDMAAIRDLPGMRRALGATLRRAWTAGIDLAARAQATGVPRLAALARVESAALARLPPSMLAHRELVARARARLALAPALLGPVTVRGVPDLDPVWRPLLVELAGAVPVAWRSHHDRHPGWIEGTAIAIERVAPARPRIARVACANPRHEALEALRWARELIATGAARPEEIAIAAPSNAEWDPHFAAMIADSNLPVAFVHGRPALETRDGQAAAALAELLLGGPGQQRVRRLLDQVRGATVATRDIPEDWARALPRDAPLLTLERWRAALAPELPWRDALLGLLGFLSGGAAVAHEAGERLLAGRALAIWRQALREGPPQAVDVSLAAVRVRDAADPVAAIAWCPAADAAACPRPFMRLLGLTSRGWPRAPAEDSLLPAHVIDPAELDPVPVAERDRRDFRTVLRAASGEVVLSRSRRDAEGRQLGASPLLRECGVADEAYLRRERIPAHAASEADRLLARPADFGATALARSARACWTDWHLDRVTAHDGLVRAGHPVLQRALAERFSASRLRTLLRDPLGYLWRYALGWDAPAEEEEPLDLDALAFGNLVHRVLELAVGELESGGGLARATPERIRAAVAVASARAAVEHEAQNAIPPALAWRRTLEESRRFAETALGWDEPPLEGQLSVAEIRFGGASRGSGPRGGLPWDPDAVVTIPGTPITIGGFIDRLDVSADRARARVTDYKTGKLPEESRQIQGGAELQRCLYAYAVQALLGERVVVEARLLYPREGGRLLPLADPAASMAEVARYVGIAREQLLAGRALIGPDSAGRNDDPLAFALPGNAKQVYIERKMPPSRELLGPLPGLWELP